MASDLDYVEYVLDQIDYPGDIEYKKMFGEYAIYCDGKIVVLICDNQVFVKPTTAGRTYIGDVVEASPYPGAKPSFLIEEQIEDRAWFSELVKITGKELPQAKPKKKRKKSGKTT